MKYRQKRGSAEVNGSPLRELMKQEDIKYSWLEKRTGYSRSQLSQIMLGKKLISQELYNDLELLMKGGVVNHFNVDKQTITNNEGQLMFSLEFSPIQKNQRRNYYND